MIYFMKAAEYTSHQQFWESILYCSKIAKQWMQLCNIIFYTGSFLIAHVFIQQYPVQSCLVFSAESIIQKLATKINRAEKQNDKQVRHMHLVIIPVDQTSKAIWEFFLKNNPYLFMQIDHLGALTYSCRNGFLLAHIVFNLHKRYICRHGV